MASRSKSPVRRGNRGHSTGHHKPVVPFGTFRFDFMRECRHDFKSKNCPFCLLVTSSVKKFFADEADRSRIGRLEAKVNRAKLRYSLLDSWTRNQPTHYSDVMLGFIGELILSKSCALAIVKEMDAKVNVLAPISILNKILLRRQRLLEIGYFAIVFLQSRIRKLIAKRRVRKMLMLRFQKVEPKNKEMYYYDSKLGRRLQMLPRMIRNERPGSPTTIERRIRGEDKKKDDRLNRFNSSFKTSVDFFAVEEELVERSKNLYVLKDILTSTMLALTDASRAGKQDIFDADGNPIASGKYEPVVLCLTGPAPSMRELGLSYVLSHVESSFHDEQVEEKPEKKQDSKKKGGKPENADKKNKEKASSIEEKLNSDVLRELTMINERLKILEQVRIDCLKCDTPDEVIDKLLLCDDMHPSILSAVHISEDEHLIWNGDMDYTTDLNTTKVVVVKDGDHAPPVATPSAAYADATSAGHAEVLPMGIALKIIPEKIAPQHIFRLFFYNAELVGITALSPWAFYQDIHEHRDFIAKQLKMFSTTTPIKDLVRTMTMRAKEAKFLEIKEETADEEEDAATRAKKNKVLYNSCRQVALRKTGDRIGGCIPSYVPPASVIFGDDKYLPDLAAVKLTDEDVLRLHHNYNFLGKNETWKKRLKIAQTNMMKSKKLNSAVDDDVAPSPVKSIRSMTMPDIHEICGTALYQLFSIDVPQNPAGPKAVKRSSIYEYVENVRRSVVATISSSASRLSLPVNCENNYQIIIPNAVESYDLAVIEVSVDISSQLEVAEPNVPDIKQQVGASSSGMEFGKLQATGGATTGVGAKKKSNTKLVGPNTICCKLYQTVGVFPTNIDRPPHNLDLGLFEWSTFQTIRQNAVKNNTVDEYVSTDATKLFPVKNQRDWSNPNPSSGITTQVFTLQSGRGNFEMRLLGEIPQKNYLEEVLPPKVKKWIKFY